MNTQSARVLFATKRSKKSLTSIIESCNPASSVQMGITRYNELTSRHLLLFGRLVSGHWPPSTDHHFGISDISTIYTLRLSHTLCLFLFSVLLLAQAVSLLSVAYFSSDHAVFPTPPAHCKPPLHCGCKHTTPIKTVFNEN